MTTATGEKDQPTTGELEAELEELRRELAARKSYGGMVQLAAFFAVLLGIAALLGVAFKVDDNQSGATVMPGQMNGNMATQMGMGAAGRSSNAAAATQVNAQLGDYWVHPSATNVAAGKVTFTATNVGKVPHELMIERMPIMMDGPGQPNEDAAQGMIDDMNPGESGRMTLNLKPGTYMLFCNAPGHYAMGQHTVFTVNG